MTPSELEADCDRCVGLCCVALAFSRSDDFGHDKIAGEPCFHLDSQFRCRIHARREDLGYDGCEAFDCLGAGQRASALFAPLNWQRDHAVRRQMHASFAVLMQLQEMRRALEQAVDRYLDDSLEARRRSLLERITDRADLPDGAHLHEDAAALLAEASELLRQI